MCLIELLLILHINKGASQGKTSCGPELNKKTSLFSVLTVAWDKAPILNQLATGNEDQFIIGTQEYNRLCKVFYLEEVGLIRSVL